MTADSSNLSTFVTRAALNRMRGAVSLESASNPGYFVRHKKKFLHLHPKEDDETYRNDSSFFISYGSTNAVLFQAVNFPSNYITFGKQSRLRINENVIGTDIDAFLWQRVEGIVYLFYTFMKFQKNTAWGQLKDR